MTFQAPSGASDGAGGNTEVWTDVLSCWTEFKGERGLERLRAGRLDSAFGAVLRIRASLKARTLTSAHRALIGGTVYNIRAVSPPDRLSGLIEIVVES